MQVAAQDARLLPYPSWEMQGEFTNSFFGRSVDAAGDVNGDGYDDVIIGSPSWATNKSIPGLGKADVYLGSWYGITTQSVWHILGTNKMAYLGQVVAGAGDVNGDGYDDVLIIEYRYGTSPQTQEGRALAFYGSSLGFSNTPNWTYEGNQQYVFLGYSDQGHTASGLGDINGDGFDDVAVANYYWPYSQACTGRVLVFHGSANGLTSAPSFEVHGQAPAAAKWQFGFTLAGKIDFNGDGLGDLIYSDPRYSSDTNVVQEVGRVYFHAGRTNGFSITPDWTWTGPEYSKCRFGTILQSIGDVNGDGIDDLFIAAGKDDPTHLVPSNSVFYGGAFRQGTDPDLLVPGRIMAIGSAGDANGDGVDDLALSYWPDDWETTCGRVRIFAGSHAGLTENVIWSRDGTNLLQGIGTSLGNVGDVNKDGTTEFYIATYNRLPADDGSYPWFFGDPIPPDIMTYAVDIKGIVEIYSDLLFSPLEQWLGTVLILR